MVKPCCKPQGKACQTVLPEPDVALIGNPNAGKTTLFNLLTGARQRTGNWPGVTVERKEGRCCLQERNLQVIDLPGTYSLDLSNTSEDEAIARQFVLDNPHHLYLNIIDASTLERGLYLTLQLRELNVPVIVLLNMMDVAARRGMKVDVKALQQRLGCPVIPVSLRRGKDINTIHRAICRYEGDSGVYFGVPYHPALEQTISSLQGTETAEAASRAQLLTALQTDKDQQTNRIRQQLKTETGEELDFLLADGRFTLATRIAAEVIHEQGKISRTLSDKVDLWALGRRSGVAIFLALMYLLFLFSINLGGAFIDFFNQLTQTIAVDGSRHLLESGGAPEWLIALLSDGLGGGLQVVATFIPVIAALYLFLTLLEESGYMSRAAFVMDQFMRKLGLSGKAFVPLIVGFGCNVPAIMATRTLDTRRERILTVLMTPFMSCGARLAVYALFAAAFFKTGGQNIVFLLYLTGIAFAILTALIMRNTLLQGNADHFVMEMPAYQIPGLRNILLNTWGKLKGFIVGAGKIIVLVVMLINVANSLGDDGSFGNQDSEKSVLSVTAKAITPIFSPMGIEEDNWPATVGIISGLLAKEVVVGTLDTLYSQMDNAVSVEEETANYAFTTGLTTALATIPANLSDTLTNLADPLGLTILKDEQTVSNSTFTAMNQYFDGKAGAFAYLLFILMYFPCVASVGAMQREVGTRWAALGVLWSTGMGYAAAVLFYQLATFSHHPGRSLLLTAIIAVALFTVVYILHVSGRRLRRTQPRSPLRQKAV